MRRTSAINLSDADAVILLQFTAEVKRAAISCATLMSWLNAVGLSKTLRLPKGVAAVVPTSAQPSFVAVRQSALVALLTPAVVVGLRGFSHFLNVSADAVAVLMSAPDVHPHGKFPDTASASDSLSSAACFAKVTLKDLIAIHERLFREFDVAELSYLSALLDDVLQGHSPLFADGELVAVRTNFTIRDIRVAMTAEAIVAQSGAVTRVVVRNLSRSGLGFEAAGAIETGEMVVVRLSTSGRQLKGRVVWKVGQKAGVEFSERLDDSDSLFL